MDELSGVINQIKQFEKLQEENNKLRGRLAVLISSLKPKIQTELLEIMQEIINNEIEQEKLCNI
jgi:hypothetical protein